MSFIDLVAANELILIGAAGGLIPDILRLLKSRYDGTFPDHVRSGYFWVSLVVLFVLGGLAVYLIGAETKQAAFTTGATAMQILSSLASLPERASSSVRSKSIDLDQTKRRISQWWHR
jgi:hypothetical protein